MTCSAEGCSKTERLVRGFCGMHYQRWRAHGDPLVTTRAATPRVVDHLDGTRTCTSCGSRLPIEQFDIDRRGKDSRRGQCKPCRSESMKAWYQANRERQAARAQGRRDRDPDRIRRQDMERYYRDRPKRIALVESAGHKRRAAKAQTPRVMGITKLALRKIHGDQCCYCGCTMRFVVCKDRQYVPDQATIEHIVPLSKGGAHDWPNVTLACRQCNLRKNRRTPDEWARALEAAACRSLPTTEATTTCAPAASDEQPTPTPPRPVAAAT